MSSNTNLAVYTTTSPNLQLHRFHLLKQNQAILDMTLILWATVFLSYEWASPVATAPSLNVTAGGNLLLATQATAQDATIWFLDDDGNRPPTVQSNFLSYPSKYKSRSEYLAQT
jgi:hypothetical protein